MNNRPRVLPYTTKLDVGVNELLHRHSFNRVSEKLLQNDLALQQLNERYLEGLNIFEYQPGKEYRQNDLVWVKRSHGDFKLFLVRCVVDQKAAASPTLQQVVDAAYVGGAGQQPRPEFDRYGWKDENSYIDIDDYGIPAKLRRYFAIQFGRHERADAYHRFGTLRDKAEADEKIMFADMSNADSSRDMVFYPYYTCRIEPNDSIIYGFYRVWDAGTIEVDLVYRLGYVSQEQSDGYDVDVIRCNDFSMRSIQYATSQTSKYFNTTKDRDIFAPASSGQSEIDDMVQLNRNDFVNTYSAQIDFPRFKFRGKTIEMADSQYMIFGSDVMSQDADKEKACIEPGANCMAYCNKSRYGFTALYVTYPDEGHFIDEGYNASNGGLVSNSFHCHVVGRWIEEPIQV